MFAAVPALYAFAALAFGAFYLASDAPVFAAFWAILAAIAIWCAVVSVRRSRG